MVALAAGLLLTLTAVPAMGFEPPSDPAGVFSCDGGPVAGHAGGGLSVALGTGNTVAAWNAVNHSEQIDLC
jgi:predicted ribosomally synthesized peptide with SipW-like signal peptide